MWLCGCTTGGVYACMANYPWVDGLDGAQFASVEAFSIGTEFHPVTVI